MNKRKIGIVFGMVFAFIAFRYFEMDDVVSIDTLLDNRERLIAFTARHYIPSIVIFMLSNIVLGAIGVPVFAVYTLAAGLIFGFVEGLIMSMSASIIGGYISFYLSRYAFSTYFRRKYHNQLEKIESKLQHKQFTYLLGLRLLPGFPYFLTNIMAGLSPIDEMTFLYSTFLGIIPSTVIFIYCGHILREVSTIKEMLTIRNFWPIIMIALMAIVAIIIKLRKNKAI
ncbi:MAG: VTT domain-containing protein [Clostridiales bacterium]|nr:VTT domain-containing protein [Clostridiales bacterium]